MDAGHLTLRAATEADLDGINAVVTAAVLSWHLPERVKRLSLPVYRYGTADLNALQVAVAETAAGEIVGVAAWEPLDSTGGPADVLLHGLYVAPRRHGAGIGTRLLEAVLEAVRAAGGRGVMVRAQREAEGFFAARGFQLWAPGDDAPRRWWRAL